MKELQRVEYIGGDPKTEPSMLDRMCALYEATRGKATHLRMSAPAITDYVLSIGPSATTSLVRLVGDDGREWHERYMADLRAIYGDAATGCSYNGLPIVRDASLPPYVVAACE